MMTITGKGFFLWKLPGCENGDPLAIADLAEQAGLTYVLIKIADGTNSSNVERETGQDLVPAAIQALKAHKIPVGGWHYLYGVDPIGEANKAIQRVQQLGLDLYVIDAEGEFKQPGKGEAARRFMTQLRTGLRDFPVGLCSYRYPSYHPQFPWTAFLEKCDFNMPQVYWMQNHNPGEQLTRCVREFQAFTPYRPVIPAGAAFTEDNWSATAADVQEFLKVAQGLKLSGASFWEWANCRSRLPDVWEAIRLYSWQSGGLKDIAQQYITALNTHDPNEVICLYNPTAVHVNAARTVQGEQAIRTWYDTFFKQTLPRATFTLTSFSGEGSSRHLSWTAKSAAGQVHNGSDTFALLNGKIAYHYTSFTITL